MGLPEAFSVVAAIAEDLRVSEGRTEARGRARGGLPAGAGNWSGGIGSGELRSTGLPVGPIQLPPEGSDRDGDGDQDERWLGTGDGTS